MKYPGKELEIFDKANLWRNYLHKIISKYIGKKVLEVGAGIGSFTQIYMDDKKDITLSEIDDFNYKTIKEKFFYKKNCKIEKKRITEINDEFDTIMYLSVLEHIEDDKEEILQALSKLRKNGNLIICAPAHNFMYSEFDKEIGHFKRYEMNFFKELKFKNAIVLKSFFIDSFGYLLYFINKLVFKKEVYPSKLKVFIWDKLFIPITYIIDFVTFYKLGKNIICVIKKN